MLNVSQIAALVLYMLILGGGQVLFKLAASQTVAQKGALAVLMSLATSPTFIGAISLYSLGTLVWIWILRQTPLSVAYPFYALTFLLVPLLSWWLLGEIIEPRYWVGVGFIVVGILVTVL